MTPMRAVPCLLLLVALAGCGPAVGNVSGTVTYKGKALPDGTVKIRGADGIPRDGRIEANGAYVVRGIPVGKAVVLVSSIDPKLVDEIKAAASGATKGRGIPVAENLDAKHSRIPLKYGDFDESGLSVEVAPGTTTYDIELK
jgi:hypothetical protein